METTEVKGRPSKVLFSTARRTAKGGLYQKLEAMFKVKPRGKVCIKVHMGELGNIRYIRPAYVSLIVSLIKDAGGDPFVFDTTVIYGSSRRNLSAYKETARRNGFCEETMGCPVVIADDNQAEMLKIKVENPYHLETIEVPKEVIDADFLIALSHVTLHEQFPIAATIKNVAMGCVSNKTKLEMHNKKAHKEIQKAATDAAKTIFKMFKGRFWGFNLAVDITQDCDCIGRTDIPICSDIGLFASDDPLALDRATADKLSEHITIDADWYFNMCSEIGSSEYELVGIE